MPEKVCVVGLGYVGLPLAAAFANSAAAAGHPKTIGVDSDSRRIAELQKGFDSTGEIARAELIAATHLQFADDISAASDCTAFIITVPTPLADDRRPDLSPLKNACTSVGGILKQGDLVVIESTVYPGVTEEVCLPILARESKLMPDQDFDCGYSPERVNPGSDNKHHLTNIIKITAGRTPKAADRVDLLYRQIISAGTHRAESIRVAEAAKIFENTQRDVNIALVNELALICDSLGLDRQAVFAAAATKWNFLNFSPGLVGGHCIGVDPYYLSYKAEAAGYRPNLILASRQINDAMGRFIADKTARLLIAKGISIRGANVLLLGFAFKENCADIRNTRSFDIYQSLAELGCEVRICDPLASAARAKKEYGVDIISDPKAALADNHQAIIFAVAHSAFKDISIDSLGDAAVIDVKGIAPRCDWRL